MKKTLLATAIAGALGVTAAAQAATVYDQDGTKVDIYGRIAMGIAGGGHEAVTEGGVTRRVDNGAEFVDAFSRLGLRLQHMVSSDLTAFGHLEWRFSADQNGSRASRNGDDDHFDAFSETRQAYLGLRSDTWGTIQAGNFDSFYNQSVSAPFDVYIDAGLEFVGNAYQSRGDSIGYITPNMNGFQVFLQAKHYSERGETEGVGSERDEEIVAQGGVVYEVGGLRLAAGFVDDKYIAGQETTDFITRDWPDNGASGNDEVLYGATAQYQFTPEFSARLGYQGRDDNSDPAIGGGYDRYGLGMSYAVNQWAFNADVYQIEDDNADDRTAWAAGAYYNISSNMDVFLELNDRDLPSRDTVNGRASEDMYYLVGARYFF